MTDGQIIGLCSAAVIIVGFWVFLMWPLFRRDEPVPRWGRQRLPGSGYQGPAGSDAPRNPPSGGGSGGKAPPPRSVTLTTAPDFWPQQPVQPSAPGGLLDLNTLLTIGIATGFDDAPAPAEGCRPDPSPGFDSGPDCASSSDTSGGGGFDPNT